VGEGQSGLLLQHGLARVESDHPGLDLARVLLHLDARQAAGVLVLRLAQLVGHQRERGVAAQRIAQLGVQMVALRRAVVAVAAGLEVRKLAEAVHPAVLAAELQRGAARAIAADEARLDDDHAAGRVAIQRGERTAQHLDPFGRAEPEGGRLSLPVGHGRRNAVGDQANAAHPERRARAEAARGDLQVLRVVLAVLHHDPGDAAEALRQVDLGAAFAQLVAVDTVHRGRDLEAGLRHARRRHHDGVGFLTQSERGNERDHAQQWNLVHGP
jgi:hypothetical protein